MQNLTNALIFLHLGMASSARIAYHYGLDLQDKRMATKHGKPFEMVQ